MSACRPLEAAPSGRPRGLGRGPQREIMCVVMTLLPVRLEAEP